MKNFMKFALLNCVILLMLCVGNLYAQQTGNGPKMESGSFSVCLNETSPGVYTPFNGTYRFLESNYSLRYNLYYTITGTKAGGGAVAEGTDFVFTNGSNYVGLSSWAEQYKNIGTFNNRTSIGIQWKTPGTYQLRIVRGNPFLYPGNDNSYITFTVTAGTPPVLISGDVTTPTTTCSSAGVSMSIFVNDPNVVAVRFEEVSEITDENTGNSILTLSNDFYNVHPLSQGMNTFTPFTITNETSSSKNFEFDIIPLSAGYVPLSTTPCTEGSAITKRMTVLAATPTPVTLNLPDHLCEGAPELVLAGQQGITYASESDGDFYADETLVSTFDPVNAGRYGFKYVYTNAAGCISEAVDTITVDTLPEARITNSPVAPLCVGNTITLEGVIAGGLFRGGDIDENTGVFTPSTAKTYQITYTYSDGTCSNFESIDIEVLDIITMNDTAICEGSTLELAAPAACAEQIASLPGAPAAVNQASGATWSTSEGTWNLGSAAGAHTVHLCGQTFSDGDESKALLLTGFNFDALPDDATIMGLSISFERRRTSPWYELRVDKIQDHTIGLLTNGNSKLGNSNISGRGPNWSSAWSDKTYGGSTDLWGTVLDKATLTDPGFGVYFTVEAIKSFTGLGCATAEVRNFSVTVHYQSGGVEWYTESTGGTLLSEADIITFDADGGSFAAVDNQTIAELTNTTVTGTKTLYMQCGATSCREEVIVVVTKSDTIQELEDVVICSEIPTDAIEVEFTDNTVPRSIAITSSSNNNVVVYDENEDPFVFGTPITGNIIPSMVLVNNTNTPQTITITVNVVVENPVCITEPIEYTITVDPCPAVLLTNTEGACNREDTLKNGEEIIICYGDSRNICAWVDPTRVHNDQTWGISYTNHTTGEKWTTNNTGNTNPYNMINTDTMSPGTYIYTVDTLEISGPGADYFKDNDLGLSFILSIVETPVVVIGEPVAICSEEDFELPLTLTGGRDSIVVTYTINEEATETVVFYHPLDNTSLLIPGKLAGTTNTVRLTSLESVPCSVDLDSATFTFEFTPDTLPIPTITEVIAQVCNESTSIYTTEEDMSDYVWSIVPPQGHGAPGFTIVDNSDITNELEVIWDETGLYSISVSYTNGRGCRNTTILEDTITVVEIPVAYLSLLNPNTVNKCPEDNSVELLVGAEHVNQAGPWRVVYSALDYYDNVVATYTVDTVSGDYNVVIADNLPAGKYRFHIDTIIDLSSSTRCPGYSEDTTFPVVNIYPEIKMEIVGTQPTIICENEDNLHILVIADSALFIETNPAIPHYTGYRAYIKAPNGVDYPITTFSFVTTDKHAVGVIPKGSFEAGMQEFIISKVEVSITNDLGDVFCEAINLDTAEYEILTLPLVNIIGQEEVCAHSQGVYADAIYTYSSEIELKKYQWEVFTLNNGNGRGTILTDDDKQSINVSFSTVGDYMLTLYGEDETCYDIDTFYVTVLPNPALVDIDDFLANLKYVNCETQEFQIGSIANCRQGELAKVRIDMNTTGLLLEYYETASGYEGWYSLNQYFVNGSCFYGPQAGFPLQDMIAQGSLFRITSTSDERVESVDYSFVIVDAVSEEPWSDALAGSFILTPVDTAAQINTWTLENNVIINCTPQVFSMDITPNCQEGNDAKLFIALNDANDAGDIEWRYSFDNVTFTSMPNDYIINIDSLIAGGDNDTLTKIYLSLASFNTNEARDVNYNVYLQNEAGDIAWDSLTDMMFRLAKFRPFEMETLQDLKGDSVICFEKDIQFEVNPNCLLSDTNMGKLLLYSSIDVRDYMEVSYQKTPVVFNEYNVAYINWPGFFNKYHDTITLTVRSINSTTVDVDFEMIIQVVDTASGEDYASVVEIFDYSANAYVTGYKEDWKIKGQPVAPIIDPDTIGVCQTHGTWIDFPIANNKPENNIYEWRNVDLNIVHNAPIDVYGVYDYYTRHYDTTTGCFSDPTLFVVDVASDPNVLRMTSFVYCKDEITNAFLFHDYFTENNPDVRYEYIGEYDPTYYPENAFPYNGWDSIPSFVALNHGTEPVVLWYTVIAHDPTDTCNSGRNRKLFSITINPVPAIPTVVSNTVYCNGTAVDAQNSPFPANTGEYIYDWAKMEGVRIFANNKDTGNGSFAFTAVNNTNEAISATFTVKPRFTTSNGTCGVDTVNFTITVLPTPTVEPLNLMTYCAGVEVPTTEFAGVATSFNWVKLSGGNNIGADVNGTSGVDSIKTFIATNTTANVLSATYRVTPVFAEGIVNCSGTYMDYTINVLPAPVVYPVADQIVCTGSKMASVTFIGRATSYEWRNKGDVINGLPVGTITSNSITDYTLTNNTNDVLTAEIVVYPYYEDCMGDSIVFKIAVSPKPKVNPVADVTLCANERLDAIVFTTLSEVPTSYKWRNIGNSIIGLPINGNDSIASVVLRNTTSAPLTATIEVTPMNNEELCVGAPITFNITVNQEPTLINIPADYELCSGDRTTPVTFTGMANTYEWEATTTHVTGIPTGVQTGSFRTYTLVNNSSFVDTVKVTVTPKTITGGKTCTGTPQTFEIIVNPAAGITNTFKDTLLCSGQVYPQTTIASVGTVRWVVTGEQIAGLPAVGTLSSGDVFGGYTLTNLTNAPRTAVVTFNTDFSGCNAATSVSFSITVNPNPTFTNKPANTTLCSGDVYSMITFTGNAASFDWTVDANGVTGLSALGTGAFGPFTLTNSGNTAATATVSVTPKYGTCSAAVETFDITVKPQPKITSTHTSQVICSGTQNAAINFTGVGTFNWVVTGDQIPGLSASGTGDIAATTLTNNTSQPLTATITVTPTVDNCTGQYKVFTITVNPTPTITNKPANTTLCSGDVYSMVSFTGNATSYDWTVTANGITGFTPTTGAGAFGPFTLTNTGSTDATATVSVTPKYGTCSATAATFNITVKPEPKITSTHTSQTICSGAQNAAINFTGVGSFNWVITGDQIAGLPASGSGNITARTLTNNTNQPLTAIITVTPASAGCVGTSQSFTITVNPAPKMINKPMNAILCSGEVYPAVTFTGTATTFDWTVASNGITGFTSTSGSNVFGAFTLTNTGSTAATATVTVTPKYDACSATAETFTITVNPVPVVATKPADVVVCHNQPVSYNFGANTEWVASGDLITGLPISGSNTLSTTLENRGTTSLTAIITVTPKSGSCIGTTYQFTITVNPEPMINNVPADYAICNNAQTSPFVFTGVATEYEWVVTGNSNINGFPTGTQTAPFGTYMLTNTTTTTQTATVTVTPYYKHGGASCQGANKTFTITVNPPSVITNTLNDVSLCSGSSTSAITFTGATNYEWVVSGDAIGLPAGIQTGNFGSYTVVNNGRTTLVATVTVTPRYIGGGVNCGGTPVMFNVIVDPNTVITDVSANAVAFCNGGTLDMSVTATGKNLTYQWFKDGNPINGATSAQYQLSQLQLKDAGAYHVVVTGTCGSVTSRIFDVVVRSGDMILDKLGDIVFIDNHAQLYSGYKWYKNGAVINGATEQFYNEKGGLNGCYSAVLTRKDGTTETTCEKCFDNKKALTDNWKLSVYPNPSKQGNVAKVTLAQDQIRYSGILEVTITSMTGSEVMRMRPNGGEFEVETIRLTPGFYNIKVVTEDGNSYNEKMIVH